MGCAWVNRHAEYDRLLDALTVGKERAAAKNAAAFGLVLDAVERYGNLLRQGRRQ